MNIFRFHQELGKFFEKGKILIIFGPRQVGKTTLLKNFLKTSSKKNKFDSGDNLRIHEILSSRDFNKIREYAEGYELLVLDEAQNIPEIGRILKIFADELPEVQVIATGSSSFELAGQVGEPLTGRKKTILLYPVAQLELKNHFNKNELKEKLEEFLLFGSYPEILTTTGREKKTERLNELANSYLLKDILSHEKIKNSRTLVNLLRLLAFQVGSEVSHHELGQKLGIDGKTIGRYLDLLEKSYVILCLPPFSKNLRKEISKKCKYFFYDNGIRNAIISNFNELALRNDTGQLWENFLITERLKNLRYHNILCNLFFWRTMDKKEVDLIEEREGKLFSFEFKWGREKYKFPAEFTETYTEAETKLINQDNYLEFLLTVD